MRRIAALALVVLIAGCFTLVSASATTSYDVLMDARVRGPVLFIGDSNETRAATAITLALTGRQDAYLPIMVSRVGQGIRGRVGCLCANSDYWKYKIANVLAAVPNVSAVVIDLGINDADMPGTATTIGYSSYAAKIDWLLKLLPAGVPIMWTNLPCSIEPARFQTGCNAVNLALSVERTKSPNLTIPNWSLVALNRTDFIEPDDVHLSEAGYTNWATLVVHALDSRTAP